MLCGHASVVDAKERNSIANSGHFAKKSKSEPKLPIFNVFPLRSITACLDEVLSSEHDAAVHYEVAFK